MGKGDSIKDDGEETPEDEDEEDSVWTALENLGDVMRGDPVPEPVASLIRGRHGLSQLESGEYIALGCCGLPRWSRLPLRTARLER